MSFKKKLPHQEPSPKCNSFFVFVLGFQRILLALLSELLLQALGTIWYARDRTQVGVPAVLSLYTLEMQFFGDKDTETLPREV